MRHDSERAPVTELAILPGRTHYDMASSPLLAEVTLSFIDDPSRGQAG